MNIAVVAVARELAGFIWDISLLAMPLAIDGDVGMRPHELLESALAASVCISIDMATQRS